MKKILCFIAAFLLLGFGGYAQSNRSAIRFRLSDGTLLSVAVNGRYFEKTGPSLVVGDLPGKRPYVKVYRFRPYADGKGGKAELIYSGTVRIKKGKMYDAIVDVGKHVLLLQEIHSFENIPSRPPFNSQKDQAIGSSNISANDQPGNDKGNTTLSAPLQALKTDMDQKVSDMEKLKTAKAYLNDKTISTDEATQIASWLFFDDTKLKFARAAYPKIQDKDNFESFKKVLMDESSKQQLEQFLKKQ